MAEKEFWSARSNQVIQQGNGRIIVLPSDAEGLRDAARIALLPYLERQVEKLERELQEARHKLARLNSHTVAATTTQEENDATRKDSES